MRIRVVIPGPAAKEGQEFTVTRDHWQTAFVDKGIDHRFKIVEDDLPQELPEIREIRSKQSKRNKNA